MARTEDTIRVTVAVTRHIKFDVPASNHVKARKSAEGRCKTLLESYNEYDVANIKAIDSEKLESGGPKTYVIYDARAAEGDTDEASVMSTASSLKEARGDIRTCFPRQGCCIYSYTTDPANVNKLINETFVEQG